MKLRLFDYLEVEILLGSWRTCWWFVFGDIEEFLQKTGDFCKIM